MIVRERYDQVMDDILKRWKNGDSVSWRSLTVKGRIAYVRACLHWSSLPNKPIKTGTYIINGAEVKNRVDFYCLLGEVFLGEKGYFGQDLHGFKDCFSEIYMHDRNNPVVEPNTTVTIINRVMLEKVLNKGYEEYFSDFVKSLELSGFIVKFS